LLSNCHWSENPGQEEILSKLSQRDNANTYRWQAGALKKHTGEIPMASLLDTKDTFL
jgi:hypothetical protein